MRALRGREDYSRRAWSGGALPDAPMKRSGLFVAFLFRVFRLAGDAVPDGGDAHGFLGGGEGGAGFFAHAHGAVVDDFVGEAGLGFVVGAAFAYGVQECVEGAGEFLFYFHVADRAGAVAGLEVFYFCLVGVEGVVVLEHGIALHGAGYVGAGSVGVGVHGHDALLYGLCVVRQEDGIAQGL